MNRTEWALGIAEAVAKGAKCGRRQVGAVLLTQDGLPLSFGKNGSPPGVPECSEGACPRGQHFELEEVTPVTGRRMCACDRVWPCTEASTPGSGYDNCIGDHAERNAIAFAPKGTDFTRAALYITHEPCTKCWVLIKACGIGRVEWKWKSQT